MAALVKNTALSSKNGGNATYLIQLKYDTATDTFIDATAVDFNGDAAGTVHVLGNQEESTFPRKDDGSYECDYTIMEQDLARLNALENLAPVTTASDEDEEVTMEDGTKIGGTTSVFDSAKPVFAIWTRIADHPVTGKKRFRHYIGQFAPAGGLKGQKAKQRNRLAFKINSIDSKSSPAIDPPPFATFPDFTGVVAQLLDGNFKHGKYIEQA
jgi:hypothetical protein